MEEIKVGEYVRTPQQGFIGKLVGDYVNGRLVLQVDYKNKNVCLLIPLTDTKANTNIMWYGYEDIKTIITKEQFALAEYRLEE